MKYSCIKTIQRQGDLPAHPSGPKIVCGSRLAGAEFAAIFDSKPKIDETNSNKIPIHGNLQKFKRKVLKKRWKIEIYPLSTRKEQVYIAIFMFQIFSITFQCENNVMHREIFIVNRPKMRKLSVFNGFKSPPICHDPKFLSYCYSLAASSKSGSAAKL